MTMPDTPELPPTDLPEPAFRLKWRGDEARYVVDKPNIGSTDCYTADQVRAILASRATRLAAAPQGWKPMHTAPLAGEFLACIEVTHGAGKGPTLWHQHVLMRDDEDGSIHTDYEQGWDLEDYHGWQALPPAPDAAPAASFPEPVAWRRKESGEWIYYATKAWDDLMPLYDGPVVASSPEAADERASEPSADLRYLWNTLMFFAHPDSYVLGERTGGVLQGCPRKPPPTPDEMAGYAKQGLAALCRHLGRDPESWMTEDASGAALASAPAGAGEGASIRYDTLHEYATANRLDYNELCRVVRAALAGEPAVAADEGREDTKRLDWLDELNATLNRRYGTNYGWRLVLSPNVVRLMSERPPSNSGHVADIDLHDSQARGAASCRDAIDAARAASQDEQQEKQG